ncbi:MAG: hypothetical protein L0Y36_03205 [Planctomycetales bacterium]|nr:hypothetical protein [Planctomycetales bacterium]
MRHFGAKTAVFCVFWAGLMAGFSGAAETLDNTQYIDIDEIRTDMDAYCLTVFAPGSTVEKFGLKVLSVVRNHTAGRHMILVKGTDERFIHSGAVQGCSGSPVFIDGRLAGALAAGWSGNLDSLYLVRPIKDMLAVGSVETAALSGAAKAEFDFSQPLDLTVYHQQFLERQQSRPQSGGTLLPLSTSLPAEVCQQYGGMLGQMGLMPAAAGPAVLGESAKEAGSFERGGVLSVILCGGDISLAGVGTVTEIVGDQVYGFGHAMEGEGPIHLPMAAGVVHSVVANRDSAFKLASPGPVLGTLEFDQSSAVRGTIGKVPKTIPLRIEVSRFNDPQRRVYNCFLADDRSKTSAILQMALAGACQMQGPLPPEHTIRYTGRIVLEDGRSLDIDNISSGRQLAEAVTEMASAANMLMNNPFERVPIRSIEARMDIEPVSIAASIWSVNVSNTKVRPGQTITASVVLRFFQAPQKTVTLDLQVPDTLAPGKYKVRIVGAAGYQAFAAKAAPQKFRAYDLESLTGSLERLFKYRRDRLYAVMPVPATGVVLRQHELGELPPTKMLLMQDAKRLLPLEPYNAWAESSISLEAVVDGAAEVEITVEK